MEWHRLLSSDRLRRPDAVPQKGRSPFQQDIDRITFSAAFRRLAHKTQVHPLSPNDHVHTRLTHSIEVASVGRSLGTAVGTQIAERLKDPKISADIFGYVVQAACLAHDIGNPPFGHSGEYAIRSWFNRAESNRAPFAKKTAGSRPEDFRKFEGNAQGFRILTQLENNKWAGGLQLTCAVLGAFTKYPIASTVTPADTDHYPGTKKIGFFKPEEDYFKEVANALGLIRRDQKLPYWCRHPLAFLVEAADDICYAIVDIEDGYELGYLNFREAKDVLAPIAGEHAGLSSSMEEREQIAKLRAVAIGQLVDESATVFLENEGAILDGKFSGEIIYLTRFGDGLRDAITLATDKLYNSDRKTKLEIAGSEIIGGLLDIFAEVAMDLANNDFDCSKLNGRSQKLARLMRGSLGSAENAYQALLYITDFVSGMTDRFAVETYRTLKGIAI
jgi:dGTPase